jgi:hypothetical protein
VTYRHGLPGGRSASRLQPHERIDDNLPRGASARGWDDGAHDGEEVSS